MIDLILAFLLGWLLRDKAEQKNHKRQNAQVGNIDHNGVPFGYLKEDEEPQDLV